MDIQTITLIVLIAGMAGTFIWKLSRVETALSEKITKSRDEIEIRQDQHIHAVGETIAAIRQKANDIELFAANNYVRRDGFYKVQEKLTEDIKELGRNIDVRLQRMEAKIDSKT